MAIHNLQPLCHFVANFLFFLGEGSIFLRLWTKAFVLKQVGWDDWAMAATSIWNAGQHAILYTFIAYGAGRPQVEVLAKDPNTMPKLLKALFAEEIWYIWLHFNIKMCFLLFYLRLAAETRFKMAIYGTMVINALVTIAIWCIYCLQCIPIETYWYPEKHPDVKCISSKVTYFVPASMLIAVDIIIFILPLHTVWSLQMTLRRRIQVLSVITLGGSSVVVSCLRLIILNQFANNPDFTYQLGDIVLTSAAEMEVAILAANMPAIRGLWTSYKNGTLSGGSSSKPTQTYHLGSGHSKPHQLSNLFPRMGNVANVSTVERDGSTRGLTRNGSDDELPSRSRSQKIMVTQEFTVREEGSIEE